MGFSMGGNIASGWPSDRAGEHHFSASAATSRSARRSIPTSPPLAIDEGPCPLPEVFPEQMEALPPKKERIFPAAGNRFGSC
jgi:hypothetical protein